MFICLYQINQSNQIKYVYCRQLGPYKYIGWWWCWWWWRE